MYYEQRTTSYECMQKNGWKQFGYGWVWEYVVVFFCVFDLKLYYVQIILSQLDGLTRYEYMHWHTTY